MNKVKIGLRWKALLAAIFSALAAFIFYQIIVFFTNTVIFNNLDLVSYNSKKMDQQAYSFQAYVSNEEISSDDYLSIDNWVDEQRDFTILEVTEDDEIIFDSLIYQQPADYGNYALASDKSSEIKSNDYTLQSATGVYNNGSDEQLTTSVALKDYSWMNSYDIDFADKTAKIYLYGYHSAHLYNVISIAQIISSVVVFALLFVFLINKTIKNIVKLEKDVKILETGMLEHEIYLKGNDELSSLANGLNNMRIALFDNMNKKEEATKANYDLVVAVSHDLRTPLTALSLYLDLLNKGKNSIDEGSRAYIEKSREKVAQIKKMSDQLFERFYLSGNDDVNLDTNDKASLVLGDSLSNMIAYLSVNGFNVESEIDWPERKIKVSKDYINRIFDNISSNIIKYADKDASVNVNSKVNNDKLFIEFSNRIHHYESKMESSEVGVKNIIHMMHCMNGECFVLSDDTDYTITLIFPLEK